MDNFQYVSISSADANSVKVITAKPCNFAKIIVLATSNQVLSFYNNPSTTTAADKIGDMKASVLEQTFDIELSLSKGLVVNVPAGYSGSCVIAYNPL